MSSCVMTNWLEDRRREQQPAAQLLVDRVMSVADGGLGHLGDQGLRVAQQDVQHLAVAFEFLLEPTARQAVRRAGALHDCAVRRGASL